MNSIRRQVLLVEDSAADQEIIRRAFQFAITSGCHFDLRTVMDGEEALNYMLHEGEDSSPDDPLPDLILLDLNLPNVSGRELLERIRKSPQLRHIPVVVLTTSQAPHEILECYRLGANCFLTKPAGFADFVEMVQRTCDFWFNLATLPVR